MIDGTIASIALIASGDLGNPEAIASLVKQSGMVIAVDGGLHHCVAMDITPDYIVGDFDSVSADLLNKYKNVPQLEYPRDKDFTDLELAITKAQEFKPKIIVLFAVLGKRADHTLYNLNLLGRLPGKLRIETESETLYAISDQVVIPTFPGQTLSLLPLGGSAKGVETEGLKWELKDADINYDFMSISNIALSSQVRVSIREGILLCSLIKEKIE